MNLTLEYQIITMVWKDVGAIGCCSSNRKQWGEKHLIKEIYSWRIRGLQAALLHDNPNVPSHQKMTAVYWGEYEASSHSLFLVQFWKTCRILHSIVHQLQGNWKVMQRTTWEQKGVLDQRNEPLRDDVGEEGGIHSRDCCTEDMPSTEEVRAMGRYIRRFWTITVKWCLYISTLSGTA